MHLTVGDGVNVQVFIVKCALTTMTIGNIENAVPVLVSVTDCFSDRPC